MVIIAAIAVDGDLKMLDSKGETKEIAARRRRQ
jgi:hypothetical protein